jgi:hypothetical protein
VATPPPFATSRGHGLEFLDIIEKEKRNKWIDVVLPTQKRNEKLGVKWFSCSTGQVLLLFSSNYLPNNDFSHAHYPRQFEIKSNMMSIKCSLYFIYIKTQEEKYF